jgi:iron(III) transport system ATP-binding protein
MTQPTDMLRLEGVSKSFRLRSGADLHAVSDVSFHVARGEFFTLLGPSGCGKSTLLRMIAGLEKPDCGRIELAGQVAFDQASGANMSAAKRALGMVFQSYAVWPHMSVFDNVAFALHSLPWRQRPGRASIAAQVRETLALVALEEIENRRASDLSGGQKQRLALARALVAQPKLILLDEPMSNLDAKLRDRLRVELKALRERLGLTFVFVTHDQNEAMAMSHRIAVMRDGRIEQIGTPREIYRTPANPFVADFIGHGTLFQGATAQRFLGVARAMLFRPEDIEFCEAPATTEGWLSCEVLSVEYRGSHCDLVVEREGVRIMVRIAADRPLPSGKQGMIRLSANAGIALA